MQDHSTAIEAMLTKELPTVNLQQNAQQSSLTMAGKKKATTKASANTLAPWVTSKAKKLLRKDIIEKRVTIAMDPLVVHGMRNEFKEYELKNFKTNLKNLHLTIQKEQRRADMDSDAHAYDLSIHPPILQTPSGYPQWQGSEAARLLKLDIEDEKHESMKPSDLHNTKDEY